jgi:hypothetical protein
MQHKHGGDKKCIRNIGLETSKEEAAWEIRLYGRIILQWICEMYGMNVVTGLIWLKIGIV